MPVSDDVLRVGGGRRVGYRLLGQWSRASLHPSTLTTAPDTSQAQPPTTPNLATSGASRQSLPTRPRQAATVPARPAPARPVRRSANSTKGRQLIRFQLPLTLRKLGRVLTSHRRSEAARHFRWR